MRPRPVRTVAAALAIAALLAMAAPVPAQASDFDLSERLSKRIDLIVNQSVTFFDSLLDNLGDFIATSTAAICGDG